MSKDIRPKMINLETPQQIVQGDKGHKEHLNRSDVIVTTIEEGGSQYIQTKREKNTIVVDN